MKCREFLTPTRGALGIFCIYISGTKILRSVDNNNDVWYNYGINGIQGITVKKADEISETEYVFRKNVQGDVTHIYRLNNGELTLAAKYTYDAWGKCEVIDIDQSTIGEVNPIRYRGYFYDTETGLYYLNARYYDPETGRFISADDTQFIAPNTINGLNLYAYCANNPVMNVDPSGHSIVLAILATLVIGAIIGGLGGGVTSLASGGDFWSGFAGGVVSGLISTIGLSLAVTVGGVAGLAISAFFGFGASFGGSAVQQGISKDWNSIDLRSAAISGVIGAAMGMITYGVTSFAMRNTVGVFDSVFDKTKNGFWGRYYSSLQFSAESMMLTLMFNVPVTIAQTIIESIKGYLERSKKNNSMTAGGRS